MTLCDDTQYVHSLSATEAGRLHDKKLADEYALHLPAGSVLRQDLRLLGHAPAGVLVGSYLVLAFTFAIGTAATVATLRLADNAQ